jgi:hypothetical protein
MIRLELTPLRTWKIKIALLKNHKSALLEDVEVRGILVRYEWTAVDNHKQSRKKKASSARETKATFRHRPLGWE